MTALSRSAWKETRALGPIWIASTAAVAAAPLWSAFQLDFVGLLAYIVGATALGAHAVGHEYAHRTIGALLAQPVRRTQILAVKLGVLAAMLIALTAAASVGPYSPIVRFPANASLDSRVLFLPTLLGLTLAPYLALVARSTLGGAVFAISVPGMLLVASDLLGLWWFGAGDPGAIDRFKYIAFPWATVAACVVAAIAIWRRFIRLEVAGDHAGHVALSISSQVRAAGHRVPRNPYWLLVAKELHLQQMTFVIVGLYICGWAAGIASQRAVETAPAIPWRQLNPLYAALLSLLVGSLASAEERQLGTLEWQALLPLAAWKQFAVKVAVICGLVLAAGIGLPILLAQFTPLPHLGGFARGAVWMMCVIALGIAIGSLYVSTLSSSAARAVATALPLLAGAVILMRTVELMLWQAVHAGWIPHQRLVGWGPGDDAQVQWTMTAVAACVAAMFLVHAFRNHAAIDHGIQRLSAQAAALGGVIAIAGIALFVLGLR